MSVRFTRSFGKLILGSSTLLMGALCGCHSAFIETTIDNQSESAARLVEVDYPSASFGVTSIAPHAQFHYRFKVQGSGTLKIDFTDESGKLHESEGPMLRQGQEGSLQIVIAADKEVRWQPSLAP